MPADEDWDDGIDEDEDEDEDCESNFMWTEISVRRRCCAMRTARMDSEPLSNEFSSEEDDGRE
jgi:hypothetical protein